MKKISKDQAAAHAQYAKLNGFEYDEQLDTFFIVERGFVRIIELVETKRTTQNIYRPAETEEAETILRNRTKRQEKSKGMSKG